MNVPRDYSMVGNPVDTWWNAIHGEVEMCTVLLGHYPPAPDVISVTEYMLMIRRARHLIASARYPQQAERIRMYLLESIDYLMVSLAHQADADDAGAQEAHDIAYHKFLMVIYHLLDRGIYEPKPGIQHHTAQR